jgi:hypothetical protein
MAVNTAKTKFIIFHTRGRNLNPGGKMLFFLQQPFWYCTWSWANIPPWAYPLHSSQSWIHYKLLGILLDEHLSFNANTNHLLSKLAKSSFIINRSKNFLPKSSLRTLYYSLFHSHLSYCPLIASCTSKTNVEKIFKAQKKSDQDHYAF